MKYTKFLLILNLFFLQSYLVRFNIGPYPSNLQEILIGITVLVCFIESLKNKTLLKEFKKVFQYKIILSFIILTLISIILVPTLDEVRQLRYIKFLFFGAVFSLTFLVSLKPTEQKTALHYGGLGAISFGIFSLIFNLLGYNIAHDYRLLGPLDSAVYLAFYLSPFFIYFALQLINEPKNKKHLTSTIVILLLLLATRSMGAIGATFLVLIAYLFQKHSKIILKNSIVKYSLLAITLILIATITYAKILPTLQTEYSSLDERGEIWQTSLHLLKEPKTLLLGTGFGQFQQHYFDNVKQVLDRTPLDYYVLQPHNIFLLFLFNFGILGFALLLYIIYQTTKNFLQLDSNTLKTIATLITLYFLIHGLIDTPIFKNDLLLLFLLFTEINLSSNRKQDP